MLVLFENLTPICMLVIEVFQSSIVSSSIPKELGGAVLVLQAKLLPFLRSDIGEGVWSIELTFLSQLTLSVF